MSNSNDEPKVPEFNTTLLEAPTPPDSPLTGSIGSLFSDSDGQQSLARLAIVENLLGLVTRDVSYHEFMLEILISVLKVVRSEAGSILEVNHDNNTLFFRAVAGTASDKLTQYTVPMGQGIVGHVAETRLPMNVPNVGDNLKYLKSMEEAVGFQARNLVAVPIVIRGKIFGVLELLNRMGEHDYSTSDIEVLTYCAEMIAKAIEARLMISSAGRQPEMKAA